MRALLALFLLAGPTQAEPSEVLDLIIARAADPSALAESARSAFPTADVRLNKDLPGYFTPPLWVFDMVWTARGFMVACKAESIPTLADLGFSTSDPIPADLTWMVQRPPMYNLRCIFDIRGAEQDFAAEEEALSRWIAARFGPLIPQDDTRHISAAEFENLNNRGTGQPYFLRLGRSEVNVFGFMNLDVPPPQS